MKSKLSIICKGITKESIAYEHRSYSNYEESKLHPLEENSKSHHKLILSQT